MTFCIQPFSEAVVIVCDINKTMTFYRDVIGWNVEVPILPTPDLARIWALKSPTNIQSCLVRAPGAAQGGLRLVQIDGVQQQYIRANSQIWDTGGIYDLNTRVRDIFNLAHTLHKHSWFAGTDPVEMVFGENKVYEWLAKGHDGIVYALIERIFPPLEAQQDEALFSAIFNSSVVVKDYDAEMGFYQNTLGFDLLVRQHDCFKEARPNVFAMPLNLVETTPYQLSMLAPSGNGAGGVEICHFPELQGNDFSQRAQPPNIGIVTLRFPVTGMDSLKARLIDNNVVIMADEYLRLDADVRVLCARTPNNNWIEFFEYQA